MFYVYMYINIINIHTIIHTYIPANGWLYWKNIKILLNKNKMEKSYDSDENGEEDNDKYLRDTKIFVAL